MDVTVNAIAVFVMTGGSVDRDEERRPSLFDLGPSPYPLTVVPSSVPAGCAASVAHLPWVHDVSATNAPPDSPSTDESDVLPSTLPRGRHSQQLTSHYRGSVITVVPSPKLTPRAQRSPVSGEQVDLKPQQSRKSAESNSPEGRVIYAKLITEEDIVEENSATGDLSSHWWAPSEGEGKRVIIPDLKAGASSSSQWRIQDSRTGSKRWSLPH